MSKPESAENFKQATTDSSAHSSHEHAGSRMRDEAHQSMNMKHHDQHAATKSEPTHLEMGNIYEQATTTAAKAVSDTANVVGKGIAGAWKASGDEANHLWDSFTDHIGCVAYSFSRSRGRLFIDVAHF